MAGSAGRVPAAVSRQRHRHQPQGVQSLPALQRQGGRGGAEGTTGHGVAVLPVRTGSHQTQPGEAPA